MLKARRYLSFRRYRGTSSRPKSRRFAPVGLETRLRAQPRQREASSNESPVVAPSAQCAHWAPPPDGAGGGTDRVRARPAAAEREGRAMQVCTKLAHTCHIAQDYLVEARVHLRLHQSLFFSSTPGRSSSSPRRRRGGGRSSDKTASLCLANEKGKSEE